MRSRRSVACRGARLALQRPDRLGALVVEDEKAFDLERAEPLCGASRVDRLDGVPEFFDEDERRTRGATPIATASGEAVDHRETEPFLFRELASHDEILKEVLAQNLMLAS